MRIFQIYPELLIFDLPDFLFLDMVTVMISGFLNFIKIILLIVLTVFPADCFDCVVLQVFIPDRCYSEEDVEKTTTATNTD